MGVNRGSAAYRDFSFHGRIQTTAAPPSFVSESLTLSGGAATG